MFRANDGKEPRGKNSRVSRFIRISCYYFIFLYPSHLPLLATSCRGLEERQGEILNSTRQVQLQLTRYLDGSVCACPAGAGGEGRKGGHGCSHWSNRRQVCCGLLIGTKTYIYNQGLKLGEQSRLAKSMPQTKHLKCAK